jgi:hypothetical protein
MYRRTRLGLTRLDYARCCRDNPTIIPCDGGMIIVLTPRVTWRTAVTVAIFLGLAVSILSAGLLPRIASKLVGTTLGFNVWYNRVGLILIGLFFVAGLLLIWRDSRQPTMFQITSDELLFETPGLFGTIVKTFAIIEIEEVLLHRDREGDSSLTLRSRARRLPIRLICSTDRIGGDAALEKVVQVINAMLEQKSALTAK